jgi:stress response protein SCP2
MFSKLKVKGITHRGDNTTGEGAGDDERIRIDLDQLPPSVEELHVVVNIYSNKVSFNDVDDAFVRLCVASSKSSGFGVSNELAYYPLDGAIPSRGLDFSRIVKKPDGGWTYEALAWGCQGRTAAEKTCTDYVRGIIPPIDFSASKKPRDLN